MTVDVHVVQDHLGLTVEGLAAVGAQVFLQNNSDPYETGNQRIHMNHETKMQGFYQPLVCFLNSWSNCTYEFL